MKENLAFRLAPDGSSKEASPDSSATLQAPPCAESLPLGASLRSLQTHRDERGSLTELFRASWATGIEAVQWNYVESEEAVLRGVHVHIKHVDYLILLAGHATIGLRDLRQDSTTEALTALVEMDGNDTHALTIPPGVAHGFYFHEPSTHIYGVSEFWDAHDELGCHWADPALEIDWPNKAPVISARDAALPSLAELVESLRHGQRT
jgi:dTDP-4-dehydrorhamnose 3,5-epimerase